MTTQTTSYKHPNDYKTSEFLQLVLDSFNSPSKRNKFLCLEAFKLYGPDNHELGTIAQDRMSDLVLDHGITLRETSTLCRGVEKIGIAGVSLAD